MTCFFKYIAEYVHRWKIGNLLVLRKEKTHNKPRREDTLYIISFKPHNFRIQFQYSGEFFRIYNNKIVELCIEQQNILSATQTKLSTNIPNI